MLKALEKGKPLSDKEWNEERDVWRRAAIGAGLHMLGSSRTGSANYSNAGDILRTAG